MSEEDVKMTPVDGTVPPVPKALAGSGEALKLAKPGATVSALRPGLKLPPRPGATVSALRPGLKLPPKPGATVSALRPGLKLPTQVAAKPTVARPVIHKPGEAATAKPLPKPIQPAAAVSEKPAAASAATPMETLKSVTQKLKGITQTIPPQAVLHKTGIVAEGAATEAQREAAKHATARISLSDAMGVAPVKSEALPMKTIRIKRPIDIPGAKSSAAEPAAAAPVSAEPTAAAPAAAPAASVTQRKTLKISRPGVGGVRPTGKFGVKRPASTEASTVAKSAVARPAEGGEATVADIPDIPEMPSAAVPTAAAPAGTYDTTPGWVVTLSIIVQLAACAVLGAVAYFLYTNTQTQYF